MRDLIKQYSFTNGSRAITVNDTRSFTVEDIRLIINETQKVVIASSMQKDNIVSVIGSVVTFTGTIPALATGDKLTIEIDFGQVATETLVNEMNVDRSIICQAVRDKGQQVNNTDNSVLVAQKIRAISSSINVAQTSGLPEYWHDLSEAVASVNDISVPYKYALLIPYGVTRVYLQGANRFDMSDGNSTTQTGFYNFDTSKDNEPATKAFYEGQMTWMTNVVRIEAKNYGAVGNVSLTVHIGETINEAIALYNSTVESIKEITLISGNGDASPTANDSIITVIGGYQGNAGFLTRWIVFSSSSPNPVHAFQTSIGDPAFNWVRKILWLFIYNVSIQGFNMNGCVIQNISFDKTYRLTNGTDDPANNTFKFIQQADQTRANTLTFFKFPDFSNTVPDSEKKLTIGNNMFYQVGCTQVVFPQGMLELTINSGTFTSSNVTQVIFPEGLLTANIGGFIQSGIRELVFPSSLKSLSITSGQAFYQCYYLSYIKFPDSMENLILTAQYAFSTCSSLTSFILPSGVQNLNIASTYMFNSCGLLSYIYISKPSLSFVGFAGDSFATSATPTTPPMKIELEDRWNYSINFGSTYPPILSASEIETFIIDRLLDLRSTAQENVFVQITAGALTTWNAVKSDGSALTGHANFQEIFRVGQVVIVNIAGTNRSYTIATIPTNNQMTMTASTSMVAGTYELNYNKVATFGATNLNKLSQAQKDKATLKEWQLA